MPCSDAARGRERACDGKFRQRLREGQDMRPRLVQREPTGLGRYRLASKQPQDHLQRFDHHAPGVLRIDAQHQRVQRQQARPDPKDRPAPRHMVQLRDAVRDHQGVVVRQSQHARRQAQPGGDLGHRGNHQFGRADHFRAAGMVLPKPYLVEAEAVQELAHLDIVLEPGGRALPRRVIGGQKHSVPQSRRCHVVILRDEALAHWRRLAITASHKPAQSSVAGDATESPSRHFYKG